MKKYAGYLLIFGIISIILFRLFETPKVIKHPDRYKGGGKWRIFPNTCGDICEAQVCGQAFWGGCDCGFSKC